MVIGHYAIGIWSNGMVKNQVNFVDNSQSCERMEISLLSAQMCAEVSFLQQKEEKETISIIQYPYSKPFIYPISNTIYLGLLLAFGYARSTVFCAHLNGQTQNHTKFKMIS